MAPTVIELIRDFEAWADPSWQEPWDNCGWQVEPGIGQQPANLLVCLTPTPAVMAEALAWRQRGVGVNLIFAHHPLIFTPLTCVSKQEAVGAVVQLAIAHQIGIYSAHTNFDQVDRGTADILAQLLTLQEVEPVVRTQPGIGYGRVGLLPSPLTGADLLDLIYTRLAPCQLLHSPLPPGPIQRLAVLGGSGASFLEAVADTGAQAYLTADCKFHQFQSARDRQIFLIDAGHFATERPACGELVRFFQAQGAAWASLSQQDEDFRCSYRPRLVAHADEPDG
ncbi:MAG: Nif3-like dinuclear metal center hexameric protein [Cyanobacteria bacterium REEB459]|nr:Nif3-like dinuclear metal center hexameric protein [Cyanobacteria bacterium REEB459]